jgi:ribosomal protein L40E
MWIYAIVAIVLLIVGLCWRFCGARCHHCQTRVPRGTRVCPKCHHDMIHPKESMTQGDE